MAVRAEDKIVRGADLSTIGEQVNAKLAEKVSSESVNNVVTLTSAEYEALDTKDPDTLYVITDGGEELYPQDGKSAYQIWLDNGNVGSEADFLASLQGNPGSSQDYPFELENSFNGGIDKALTAEKGKELYEMFGGDSEEVINTDSLVQRNVNITPSTPYTWTVLKDVYSKFLLLDGGKYRLENRGTKVAIYALLTTDSAVSGETPDWLPGYESRLSLAVGAEVVLENIPAGTYLCFRSDTNSVAIPYIVHISQGTNGVLRRGNIVDNLESSSSEDVLSAKQGRLLRESLTAFRSTGPYVTALNSSVRVCDIGKVSVGDLVRLNIYCGQASTMVGVADLKDSGGNSIGSVNLSGDMSQGLSFEITATGADDAAYISITMTSGDLVGLVVDAYVFPPGVKTNEPGEEMELVFKRAYVSQASARTISLTLNKGELYYARFGARSSANPHMGFTVCTYDGSANVDYFVETNNAQPFGEKYLKCTKDVGQIKFYLFNTNSGFADSGFIEIYKIGKRGWKAINDARLLDLETNYGEAVAENNKKYATTSAMGIVFLDCSYRYFSVVQIKRILDQMYSAGLHFFEFGFWGSGHGISFKLDDMTFIAGEKAYDVEASIITSSGKYLTESDVEEIITYAANKDIEIIPSVDAPGHMNAALTPYPEYRWDDDGVGALDIFNPSACDYAIGFVEMYAKWFAARGVKHFNIGCDEWADVTTGYYSLFAKHRYAYADFINRLAHAVAKYRFVIHCWNDPLYLTGGNFPIFNRGMMVHYWSKQTNNWATAQKIKAMGHELINASQSIYWVANGPQVSEAGMRNFNVENYYNSGSVASPSGAAFCIWIGKRENPAPDDDGEGITTTVLPLIQAFGETIANQF